MKKIEAIIKPFKLAEVKDALENMGLAGMTVSEVKVFASRKSRPETNCSSSEHQPSFSPKIKIEVVVPDEVSEEAATTIVRAAKTGRIGDGRVFIVPIEEAIRIRTSEKGTRAV